MMYFIVKNIYSQTDFESYHIVKAEDWLKAVNIVRKYNIYEGETRPEDVQLFAEGTKEEFQAIFFRGTPVYTESNGGLKTEHL